MKSLKNAETTDISAADSIKRIRKPLFKTVSLSTLNRDSELYQCYLMGNLTKSMLLNSLENPFVVAFFYNEIYDIKEYLVYLMKNEMSNQSYNIIKHYSKGLDVDFINKLTCISDKANRFNSANKANRFNSTDKVNRLLRGELYRLCEVDQSMNFNDDPYVFVGYCSIGNTVLPIFEESFNFILSKNRIPMGILIRTFDEFGYLSSPGNQIVSCVLSNFDQCFDSLIDMNVISKILKYIDFNNIKLEQIVKICNNKDSESESLDKILLIENNFKFYQTAIQISTEFEIYMKIKESIYKRIYDNTNTEDAKLVFSFLVIGFYHEPNSFNISIFKDICSKLQMDETREYKLLIKSPNIEVSDDIQQFKYRIIHSKDIVDMSTIFLEFQYLCSFNQICLESILDLPEKFFSTALRCIDSESAKNLKIFNDNLLNERLKMHVYQKIDRDVFIKYLIKRYKLFDVDITGYEYLMDDKYKIMYGIYNADWACKNIDELKRIGITEKLYNAIRVKNINGCLDGVVPVDRVVCLCVDDESKRIKVSNLDITDDDDQLYETDEKVDEEDTLESDDEFDDDELNTCESDIDESNNNESNTEESNNNESDIDESNNNESNTEESNNNESNIEKSNTGSNLIDNVHANTVLQNIFNNIKDNIPEITDEINDDNEFVYIIQSLFDWTKNNKLFVVFVEFFKKSVISFNVKYSQIKNIIFASFNKFKDTQILESVSSSLIITDIPALIDDCMLLQGGHVHSLIDSIIHGLTTRFRKRIPGLEYHNLIKYLVNSNSVNYVTVGASLFSLLEAPEFNLDHLLTFRRDDVVLKAVKQLKNSPNDILIKILFTRGLTDELSAEICKKLDLSTLTEKDMHRIYSLFYLNPLNFIKYEIYEHGFNLDEHIVIDLIRQLPDVFSETLFCKITDILNTFEMTQSCYDQMIISLENSNYMFKDWVFSRISTDNISLPFFIKLCWFICNEDDIDILGKALKVLKKGRTFDIIDKWAKMKKFERLTRRVYPLKMTDKNFYNEVFSRIENPEEKQVLREVYDLE